MPLCFRVIARLDLRNAQAIQPIRREGVRVVGDPTELATRYADAGADEIYICDAVASLYSRDSLCDVVDGIAAGTFVPVVVSGGIRNIADVRALLNAGADRVAVCTAAIERPALLDELTLKFGSSTIALQLDAKYLGKHWVAYTHGGRQPAGLNAVGWALEATARGVGEIIITSIDRDGRQAGMDLSLLGEIASRVSVPVVLSGGLAIPQDAYRVYNCGGSGVAVGAALHYNAVTIDGIKQHLKQYGAPVRCES